MTWIIPNDVKSTLTMQSISGARHILPIALDVQFSPTNSVEFAFMDDIDAIAKNAPARVAKLLVAVVVKVIIQKLALSYQNC